MMMKMLAMMMHLYQSRELVTEINSYRVILPNILCREQNQVINSILGFETDNTYILILKKASSR